jgi:hypothetical protein
MRTFEMTIQVQVPDNFGRAPTDEWEGETIEHLTELAIHGKDFDANTKIWKVAQIRDFHVVPDSAVESDFTEEKGIDEDIYVLPHDFV